MIIKGVEKNENSTATFQAVADAAEFDSAINTVYRKAKKNIAVPASERAKLLVWSLKACTAKMCSMMMPSKNWHHKDSIWQWSRKASMLLVSQKF